MKNGGVSTLSLKYAFVSRDRKGERLSLRIKYTDFLVLFLFVLFCLAGKSEKRPG